MTKIERRRWTEKAAERGTELTPYRSELPTVGPGHAAFRFVRKQCGRCGVAAKKSEFCSACRKFFLIVNGPKSIFTSTS